ncbi:hypothetical protein HOLleu_06115 [Holothuria leucospilota]|uniref:Uncharacterized protein n=1 Tax=Holothuria leucospilota TaxID=206669 RepID=A0A9Q1CMD4_HOLLE|nr:hypothetical protein HOLleu_06115 [Holothuria leucospilota]
MFLFLLQLDEVTVCLKSEEQLKRFLPSEGDRLFVKILSTIVEEGIRLFFPNAKSSKEKVTEFEIELLDLLKQVYHDTTVEQLYEQFKIPLLRFYIATTPSNTSKACDNIELSSDTDDFVDPFDDGFFDVGSEVTVAPCDSDDQGCYQAKLNKDVMGKILEVRMVQTNGKIEEGEGHGILRDALTEFWSACSRYLNGHGYQVPIIRHDFGKEKWEIIGRILLKGWNDTGYFPIMFAPVFMEQCVYGDEHDGDILESFMMYVSDYERETFKCALDSFLEGPDEF